MKTLYTEVTRKNIKQVIKGGNYGMIIGVPKEIKNNENRVALTPAGVVSFINAGHKVLVEKDAGIRSGFTNENYVAGGAEIIATAADVWAQAELIIKVKEPLSIEYSHFREGLILFTYLHLAAEPSLAQALKDQGVIAIAYETLAVGRTLPLLTPMSEVAGRMAAQIGAQFLEKTHGGQGILLGGVPGVADKGVFKAISENGALKLGVNVANGEITYESVAKDLGYDYVTFEKALEKINR